MDREFVIREIKRTALENGGAPLGVRRFERATGIRDADWRGKLWPRWSDALDEAGFAPNTLRSAIPAERLLQAYADLAESIGRLPSTNDLRFKHRQSASFPDAKVFERFGPKAELVQRLHAFLLDTDQYPDVAALCVSYEPRVHKSSDVAPREPDWGHVYLMKSGRFHKIGMSNAVGRREYELAVQLPERVEVVHSIRTDDPAGIERYWHQRFASKRQNGEWFNLNAADVAAFKRRRFM